MEEYGAGEENYYHTAICTGLCKVKDVYALFGIESDDESLIDDGYDLSIASVGAVD